MTPAASISLVCLLFRAFDTADYTRRVRPRYLRSGAYKSAAPADFRRARLSNDGSCVHGKIRIIFRENRRRRRG